MLFEIFDGFSDIFFVNSNFWEFGDFQGFFFNIKTFFLIFLEGN